MRHSFMQLTTASFLLMGAICLQSCNSKDMPTPTVKAAPLTALEKMNETYGGKTDKSSYVDVYTKTNLGFISGLNFYFDNHYETVVNAGMNNLTNPGSLYINGTNIPYTGTSYYKVLAGENESPFNGTNLNIRLDDYGWFPSFSGDLWAVNEMNSFYYTVDSNRSINRSQGFVVGWNSLDTGEEVTVILEGSGYQGDAPAVVTKKHKGLPTAITISSGDLASFSKCAALNIYVCRGKVSDDVVSVTPLRVRSVAYSFGQVVFQN